MDEVLKQIAALSADLKGEIKSGLQAVEAKLGSTQASIDANSSSLQTIHAWRSGVDSQVSDLTTSVDALRKQIDRVVVGVGLSALGTPPGAASSTAPPATFDAGGTHQELGSGQLGHGVQHEHRGMTGGQAALTWSSPVTEHKPSAATSARMTIVHRHGPCSPLADAHGKPTSHAEILAADQNRVESIQHRASATATDKLTKRAGTVQPSLKKNPAGHSTPSSTPSLPASSGRALGTGNYVVTVGLGTPASPYTVVFDTGSDTTWVQCRPCVVKCYKQKQPLFDPAKSSTYANISCTDPACADLDQSGCSGGHCLYGLQYGDGSSTVGFYAQDTLTIAHDAVMGFRFGCGEKNSGLFGKAAGLMGLGRGSTSLTVQASGKYGGAFAYCLPASSSGTTGHLDFGPGAAPANAKLTPMLTDKGQTFYYVGLTGIRVGGEQLSIPETIFSTGGTIVDSGTVITRLPATANAALSSAFDKAMAAKGYKKAAAFSILDTCYDFTGVSEAALPAVSLVFQGGATLDVDASGIMFAVTPAQVCLAFASNGDDVSVGIIGNTQQKTHAVLFDLGKKTVGFAPGAC